MKIKTKKQLNLPQLIEWGWSNPSLSRNKRFFSKDENLGITKHCVHFNDFGYPEVDNRYCLEPSDTFTVEVEEEITEDTRLEHIIEVYKVDGIGCVRSTEHNNVSISQMKNRGSIASLAFYILNDDMTMTPIWTREKGLVE